MLLSLATGACHDLVLAPYKGKGTGKTTLLRAMVHKEIWLKVVETSSPDAVYYAVVMDMGTKEVIVALFKVNQVIGVFSGEMASPANGAPPTQRSA